MSTAEFMNHYKIRRRTLLVAHDDTYQHTKPWGPDHIAWNPVSGVRTFCEGLPVDPALLPPVLVLDACFGNSCNGAGVSPALGGLSVPPSSGVAPENDLDGAAGLGIQDEYSDPGVGKTGVSS